MNRDSMNMLTGLLLQLEGVAIIKNQILYECCYAAKDTSQRNTLDLVFLQD